MSTSEHPAPPPEDTPPASDPDAIRADIEKTREDLAQTVDALQAKLDVKGQAKAKIAQVNDQAKVKVAQVNDQAKVKVAQVKDQATTDEGKPRPEVLAGAGAVVLLVVGLVWWRSTR